MSRPSLLPGKKFTYTPGPTGMTTPSPGPSSVGTTGAYKSAVPLIGTVVFPAILLLHPHSLSMSTTSGM